MNAYATGFRDKCSSLGLEPSVLVKKAQQAGLASSAIASMLEQPAVKDVASTYAVSKMGELANLIKMIRMLKGEGPAVGRSIL